MRTKQASQTAAWVAAARSLGALLPNDCQLCHDPYGVRFADGWLRALAHAGEQHPAVAQALLLRSGPVGRMVFYMQVRTRFIDDALRAFAADGGKQVVLLGAGYDCRALRFAAELPGLTFYEVDHPATQAVKRELLGALLPASARFVRWDFQHDPMPQLPDALAALGHDRHAPTLTIWEGVTMYLDPATIDASFAAIRSYSATTSKLVLTYFDRDRIDRPSVRGRAVSQLVASVGEPFRFGWLPAELSTWLPTRGFQLRANVADTELSERWLPARYRSWVPSSGRHFAIAERT